MENKKINYQSITDTIIKDVENRGEKPHLMLHSCCAPCSSYVLEYLIKYFKITILYYNPNISPESEFEFRYNELKRLITEMNLNIDVIKGEYESEKFFEQSKGLENLPEDSERCYRCYRLRLRKTAEYAKKTGCDYFTTTLSISPHKNAVMLNSIGKEISDEFGISYLYSDFKKKNGYKRSCELSEIYNLYRQNYCGCIFSKINSQQ